MFRRKTAQVTKVIELSDETKQALTSLENDLQVLAELNSQVLGAARLILGKLHGEIVEEVGVEPFASDVSPAETVVREPGERIRASAFRRRPKYEQIAEGREILSDGNWHDSYTEARKIAGDEREYRYLRAAIGRVFLDLHESGEAERRGCSTSRAMFEYRAIPGAEKVL